METTTTSTDRRRRIHSAVHKRASRQACVVHHSSSHAMIVIKRSRRQFCQTYRISASTNNAHVVEVNKTVICRRLGLFLAQPPRHKSRRSQMVGAYAAVNRGVLSFITLMYCERACPGRTFPLDKSGDRRRAGVRHVQGVIS